VLVDALRRGVDAKQCSIDDARDGVISQYRLASEALTKSNPQTILKTEVGRQDAHVAAAERQM
tara:strand:- start:1474 stop:1662 length:189 start_codon:yes stop_codon:yes gene_type:complete